MSSENKIVIDVIENPKNLYEIKAVIEKVQLELIKLRGIENVKPDNSHDTRLCANEDQFCKSYGKNKPVVEFKDFWVVDSENGRKKCVNWMQIAMKRLLCDIQNTRQTEVESLYETIDTITVLISELCGKGASGSTKRSFKMWTENGEEFAIILNEPSFNEADLGSQTWGSSILLSRKIARKDFDISKYNSILELGSGTGLVGTTLSKVLADTLQNMFRENQNYSTDKSVVITDFIPALLDKIKASLTDNIGCTFDASSTASISNSKICSCNCTVKVEKFDWFTLNKLALKTNSDSDIVVPPRANYLDVYGSEACEIEHNSNNNGVYQDFDLERYARSFDLIIAADVLYELEHAKIIPKVVKHLLVSKASPHANKAANDGLFVIVVPLRKTHKLEVEVFEQQMCAAGFELLKVFQCSLQQDLEEWADRIKESGNLDRVSFQKVLEIEGKTQELYKCYFWANK